MRGDIYPTYSDLSTRWGELSASRHGSALSPVKVLSQVPIGYEAEWALELVSTQRLGEILPLPGIEPSSCSLQSATVLTEKYYFMAAPREVAGDG
jgi:hypothetical protein